MLLINHSIAGKFPYPIRHQARPVSHESAAGIHPYSMPTVSNFFMVIYSAASDLSRSITYLSNRITIFSHKTLFKSQ